MPHNLNCRRSWLVLSLLHLHLHLFFYTPLTMILTTSNKGKGKSKLARSWLAALFVTTSALNSPYFGCCFAYTFGHYDSNMNNAKNARNNVNNNNNNHLNNNVVQNRVELRLDPHGGTGLYANEAIQAGQTLNVMAQKDVVFRADEHSVIGTVIEKFFGLPPDGETNGFTESCSIGATLASWKLLADSNHRKHSGIRDTTAYHASTLPWEQARWQLPLLWSDEVLDQALEYGQQQALFLLEEEEQESPPQGNHPNYNTYSQQQQQQQKEDIQQACESAKRQVLNFQLAAACLAEELGPALQKQYGMDSTPAEVSLVCHQALALVFSRTFLHAATGEKCMFPTIDSANHHATPNAETKSDPHHPGGVLLVACRPIQKDEEITITYGLEDANAGISFSGYGFVPNGMAQNSVADKALQLAARKGQDIAKALFLQNQQQQQWSQQQQSQ